MIRPATPDDAREIAVFYHDIRQDTVPPAHDVEDITGYIGNHLIPRGSSYLWQDNQGIIAWLDVHDGWVEQLYCKGGHTGKGLGKQLLDFAKSQFPTGLQLWTFQINQKARDFYRREGFIEVELTDGRNNEERSPDVRLIWKP